MQPFIIMTDYAEVNTAVESMKLGSIDYIPKDVYKRQVEKSLDSYKFNLLHCKQTFISQMCIGDRHNTCPDMMRSIGKDEHGNDIKMRDSEGIQLANAKIDEIRNGFSEWLEEQSPQFKELSLIHI